MLITWRSGRAIMTRRLAEQGIPLKPFLASLAASPPTKVEGTAIFMTASTESVPHALLHNLKHNRVLHEKTVFLTIVHHDVPVVPPEDRVQYERLGDGFYRLEAWYGFKEQPDIDEILNSCRVRYGLGFDLMDTSFFLSRETVIPAELPGMAAVARPPVRLDDAQRHARHGLLQHSREPRCRAGHPHRDLRRVTMGTPPPRGRGIHPLIAAAAVSVTAFALVGIAALLGWLPNTRTGPETPAGFAAPGQQVSGGVGTKPAAAAMPPSAIPAAPAPVARPVRAPTPAEAKRAFQTQGKRLEGKVSSTAPR